MSKTLNRTLVDDFDDLELFDTVSFKQNTTKNENRLY